MDLGLTQKKLKSYSDKWSGFKTRVITEFDSNPENYIKRISKLIETSLEYKADLILLPACALVYNKDNPKYKNIYQRFIDYDSVIIAGTLFENDISSHINKIPLKLLINNDFIRYIEIEFGYNKKAYAVMMSPLINKLRIGNTYGRKYTILDGLGDIVGPKDEYEYLVEEASVVMNKYTHLLDYSKDRLSTEQVLQKLKELLLASPKTIQAITEHSKLKEKGDNLFTSEEQIIDRFGEGIIVAKKNKILEEFDTSVVKWLQISNISAMVV